MSSSVKPDAEEQIVKPKVKAQVEGKAEAKNHIFHTIRIPKYQLAGFE